MGIIYPNSMLSKPRGLVASGFDPISAFGSDLALWLDPSYGVYTDRSTQLTAASTQHWSRAAASCVDLDIADNDAWVAGWSYHDAIDPGVAHLGVGKQGVGGGWYVYQFGGFVYADMNGALINTAYSTSGAWCFWMAYHDSVNNVIAVSKNGGAFATAALVGGVGTAAAADMRIGRYGTMYHDGRHDSIMFGKSPVGGIAALATTIRDYLYNSGSGRVYADLSATQATAWGLVSAWDFDGDGLDAHGSNDLTAVNSPTYTSGIASGIAGDGDVVSLVVPRVGTTATAPSYAARPTWYAGSGKPYIQSATDWELTLASTIAQATSFQVYAAYKMVAGDTGAFSMFLGPSLANEVRPYIYTNGQVLSYLGSSASFAPATADTLSAGTKTILMWGRDATKSYSRIGAGTLREETIASNRSVWQAVSRYGYTQHPRGEYYDILVVNRILSTAEETQLRNWLAAKNGVTL